MDKASGQHLEKITNAFADGNESAFRDEINSMGYAERASVLKEFAKQQNEKAPTDLPVIDLVESEQHFVTSVAPHEADSAKPQWSEGPGQSFGRWVSESFPVIGDLFSAAETAEKAVSPSPSSDSVATPSASSSAGAP